RPEIGDSIQVDICSNNLNQFSKPSEWRTYVISPDRFHATSWNGSFDFGNPKEWRTLILGDSTPIWKQWLVHRGGWIVLTVGLALGMLVYLLWVLRLRAMRFKDLVQKSSIQNEQLLERLSRITQSKSTVPRFNDTEHSVSVRHLHETLSSRLTEITKPSDLAQAMNISLRQLQRICKDELGTTPGSYITMYKLERAGQALRSSDASIKQIAFELGYRDPNYFSKVFKKYFEQSPKEYRG
ncbi:MAG: helix-turn-helix transcriptional regulator, partial [Bacteroidota bacterium]